MITTSIPTILRHYNLYKTTMCFQLSCLSLTVIIRFMDSKIFLYGISCIQNLMYIMLFSFMYIHYRNNKYVSRSSRSFSSIEARSSLLGCVRLPR
jgi:hypothetical protein